jgi:hypothetical protein
MGDTTIKITEELRDRLRILADERGMSTRAVVEEFIANTATQAEREAAVRQNLDTVRERFGIETTAERAAATSERLWALVERQRRENAA